MTLLSDTTPEAERVLIDVYRRMPMAEKWRRIDELYRTARVLHETGFRRRCPGASQQDVVNDWMRLTLGPGFTANCASRAMEWQVEGLREVRRVVAALAEIGVASALGGSMASSILGVPRFTQDADLMAEPFPGREADLAARFGSEYYISVPAIQEANRTHGSFNIINLQSGFKVDVFVRKERPFDRSAMGRRVTMAPPDAPDEPVDVLAAEDVILFKLDRYRLGNEGSDRQWADVVGLLQVLRGRTDEAYLHRWAVELGVEDLLGRAQQESIRSEPG